MLSIFSLIICIVALMFTFASYAKVKNVSEENIRINKNSLKLKATISTMSNNIENLKDSQKDLYTAHNALKKSYTSFLNEHNNLLKRVEFLENENRDIKQTLQYYNMLAPGLKFKSSFYGKMKKGEY